MGSVLFRWIDGFVPGSQVRTTTLSGVPGYFFSSENSFCIKCSITMREGHCDARKLSISSY